jgi:hypothetical protein
VQRRQLGLAYPSYCCACARELRTDVIVAGRGVSIVRRRRQVLICW